MLIELLVTCVLAEGQTFTPPKGWVVQKVKAYDASWICDAAACFAINAPDHPVPTSVTLSRSAAAGETISVPDGCKDLTASQKP